MSSSYLLLNDLRFHYLVWNQGGEGRPVILHHGLASTARIWELVAPILAQADHPVYALDARGHGLTDKPDTGYDFTSITGDLALLLDACRLERPLLVGHSWGAGVVLAYATRFGAGPRRPDGIVLVDGGIVQMDDGQSTWEETRQRLAPPKLAGMPVDEFVRRLKAYNTHWQPGDEAITIYLNSFDVTEEETITPRLTLERHMAILRAVWEMKTHALFARLQSPALAILAAPSEPLGEKERLYLEAREKGLSMFLQACPQAQALWMKDTIHDIPLQRPAELAQVILDFEQKL